MKPSIAANLAAIREAAKAHNQALASQAAPAVEPIIEEEPSSLPPVPPQPADGAWPPAEKPAKVARPVQAPAPEPAPEPEPYVPYTGKRLQCNVRLSPDARERVRAAAFACRISEQELIERWALTLPAPEVAKMPWEQ